VEPWVCKIGLQDIRREGKVMDEQMVLEQAFAFKFFGVFALISFLGVCWDFWRQKKTAPEGRPQRKGRKGVMSA